MNRLLARLIAVFGMAPCVVAFVLIWAMLMAPTYHVATDGNDSRNTTLAQDGNTPWLTIQHAIATPSDANFIISIHAGNYTELLDLTGISGKQITFQGATTGGTTALTHSFSGSGKLVNMEATLAATTAVTFKNMVDVMLGVMALLNLIGAGYIFFS
jgi:pectin methylesterase-like acyl-CoA thioesterase